VCTFCDIARGSIHADRVLEDELSLAFLDHRPLFPGHCLLIPKAHYETLGDLPDELVPLFFVTTKLLARAVETAVDAHGTFVAINNRVSQSVPHLHVHVVPRRRKDGLRGFFWPRRKYRDANQISEVAKSIRSAVEELRNRRA
jgi:histidine triad (HIT) family protein